MESRPGLRSEGYIPGTVRYEVLKAAQFHCELCGVSADEKALEVDHLVPRNRQGTDDISNLQAVCYSCNGMKRDRDDTDFRAVKASYEVREPDCVFCNLYGDRLVSSNELAISVHDRYPVTPGHTLVIPKRHVASVFDLSRPEQNACRSLIEASREQLLAGDPKIAGFNLGANDGEAGGQTVFHCHWHLIPRRSGDVKIPRGGVRNVIPGKGDY